MSVRKHFFATESTCSDFLYFQALTIFKEAILREWPLLSADTKNKLRQYVLQYTFTKKGYALKSMLVIQYYAVLNISYLIIFHSYSLPAYIQQLLLTLISVIVKRGMLDSDGKDIIEALIDHVSNLAFQDTHVQVQLRSILNMKYQLQLFKIEFWIKQQDNYPIARAKILSSS